MTDVAQVMTMPIAQQLLRDEPILHLSYISKDGGPRVIPIGYLWDGHSFRMWTVPGMGQLRRGAHPVRGPAGSQGHR
jgi:nitroimidazol reductase NimA-like FMN-containing flavoprotein (pyridoxamine 5'-phosphate oxidase superfamily)